MKFQIIVKDPNLMDQLADLENPAKIQTATEFIERYVKYGEYLSLEFDTETPGIVKVLKP
jgi:hypothetical protein